MESKSGVPMFVEYSNSNGNQTSETMKIEAKDLKPGMYLNCISDKIAKVTIKQRMLREHRKGSLFVDKSIVTVVAVDGFIASFDTDEICEVTED